MQQTLNQPSKWINKHAGANTQRRQRTWMHDNVAPAHALRHEFSKRWNAAGGEPRLRRSREATPMTTNAMIWEKSERPKEVKHDRTSSLHNLPSPLASAASVIIIGVFCRHSCVSVHALYACACISDASCCRCCCVLFWWDSAATAPVALFRFLFQLRCHFVAVPAVWYWCSLVFVVSAVLRI